MALSTDNEDLTVGLTASDLKVKLYDGSEVTLQKFTAEPIDGVKPNSVLCRRPDHEACMVGKSWTKDSMKLRESMRDAVTKAMAAGAGKGQPKAANKILSFRAMFFNINDRRPPETNPEQLRKSDAIFGSTPNSPK